MPKPDATHREYDKRLDQWERCRDCVSGTDAVKDRGARYLPMLSGQSSDEYTAYKQRALFYNATKRTVQGLMGAVFRKDVDIDYGDEEFLTSVSERGDDAQVFCSRVMREVLTTGRVGLLADADPKGMGSSYITLYRAENILDWGTYIEDGRRHLSYVRLQEEFTLEDKDGDIVHSQQIRLLYMDGEVYTQKLYRKSEDLGARGAGANNWVEVTQDADGSTYPVRPAIRGRVMNFIPFVFIGATDLTPDTEEPPLLDLVDVNLSHYRTSADLEHGAHFTGLPTPWVAGFAKSDKSEPLRIGSATAWVASDPNAKAGYLEFTGAGLSTLVTLMESKEKKMAILGARLLEDQKRDAEATETLRIRLAGESGSLMAMVSIVSEGMQTVFEWCAEWDNVPGEIEVEFNNDFVSTRIEPQEITALLQAYQAGTISLETFLWNLERGEILPPGVEVEDEIQRIEDAGPDVERDEGASEDQAGQGNEGETGDGGNARNEGGMGAEGAAGSAGDANNA